MTTQSPAPTAGSTAEVLAEFGRLGLTSFGGPVAHIGFFREAFVVRRRWLSDAEFADLVALCQFLPGPTSSQLGMAIGLSRAGYRGMLAAWVAFTLPSALLMLGFAYGAAALGWLGDSGLLSGLKAAAVAIVAQAVWAMAKSLTPDVPRACLAAAAMLGVLLVPGPFTQVAIIVLGGLAGWAWLRPAASADAPHLARDGAPRPTTTPITPTTTPPHRSAPATHPGSRRVGTVSLAACAVLLLGLPLLAAQTQLPAAALADSFSRAGALVFGGGHVVLPLLEADITGSGLVERDTFLAGYGAAQALPGPLFAVAAYLGASTTSGPTGITGAAIALVAIFLPGALLMIGVLPFWQRLRQVAAIRRALLGINAAVVGLLAAALYDPVITQGVTSPATLAIAAAIALAQARWRAPAWAVVIGAGICGLLLL